MKAGGGGGGVGQTEVHPADTRGSAAELQTAVGLQSRGKDGSVRRDAVQGWSRPANQTRPEQTKVNQTRVDQSGLVDIHIPRAPSHNDTTSKTGLIGAFLIIL